MARRVVPILMMVVFVALSASLPTESQAAEKWKPIGCWKCPGGFTAKIDQSASEPTKYRYRYFMSDQLVWDKVLKKEGKVYKMVDAPRGEYFKIESGKLKSYDKEGPIDTCPPC